MTDEDRELGVDVGDLEERLDPGTFPIEHEDLLAEYGDHEIEMEGKTTTLEELVGPLGEDEYRDFGELETAITNMVGDEAIGRKNYSDRTPPAGGERRQDEGAPGQEDQGGQESF